MVKRTFLFFLTTSFVVGVFSFSKKELAAPSAKQQVLKTIIVDPGHGGGDAGAKGSYSYEKDICLGVSLKVGKMLEKEFPDTKVLYTRTTDTYPALSDRANFANNNKGDLFLCIHVNSAPARRMSELIGHKTVTYYTGKGKNRKKRTKQVPQYRHYTVPSTAKGTETYIWGSHKNDDKEVAIRENAPMMQEENYEEKYGTIDVNSPEFIALSLLKTKQFFKRSATLAGYVQDEFVKVGRVDRDVRQRQVGIWVLQATAMPSVLVETGFISNPEEERYLNSEEGQTELAECIIRAVRQYEKWLQGKQTEEPNNNTQPVASAGNTKAFLEMVENKEKNKIKM
ncbi:MAG: N-acetylmuramoyl-L-alanine amidase [Chitinophagaceae bacterium]|nr:N-acetylmuramoyl-L-alanine amidase [Chitinophagaceae bacterium]